MDRDPSLIEFGKIVRELRIERGLTQRALAEKFDSAETTVSRMELGKFNPSLIWFIRLATALDMTPAELIAKWPE